MEIKNDIEIIKERNMRVEQDKAWEVSRTRRLFIALATYFTAVVWLLIIEESIPLLKAFVPAGGYLLSTLSLPFLKRLWLKNE